MKSRPNNSVESDRNWAHSCINCMHHGKLLWENNILIKNWTVTGTHVWEYPGKNFRKDNSSNYWRHNSSFYSTILWV